MRIKRQIDVEDEIRQALSEYITAYCRPLPAKFKMPCILIQQVGCTDEDTIDTFNVVLDARAKTEAEAMETLRNPVGITKEIANRGNTALRYASINSSGSWGNDPARPDIAMCSATLRVVAHQEDHTIGG